MGWFDEQIRQRKRIDEDLFQDSYENIAHKVLGEKRESKDVKTAIKRAIDDVFYFYHYPKINIPAGIDDPMEQIEYAANSVGVMKASIELSEGWYTDCFGPIICFFKDTHMPIALFPLGFARYYYQDPATGKKVVLGKKNARLFEDSAIAFYEPLALKQLGIPDLLTFMERRISGFDIFYYVMVTVLSVGVAMLLPRIANLLTGRVVQNNNYRIFSFTVLTVLIVLVLQWLFKSMVDAVSARINWKVSIPVEQAVMQRILTLPVPFFREYSAGELSSRADSISSICEILIKDVLAMGIYAMVSLAYIGQILRFAPSLVQPAILVIVATVIMSAIGTFMQMNITKRRMLCMAKEHGISYSIIGGIQKIKLAGAEKRIFSKWADQYAEGASLAYNPPFFLKISNVLTVAISLIGNIFFYGLAIKNGVSVSKFYAFNLAYVALFSAFSQLLSSSIAIAQIKPVLDMAEPILKAEPEKTLKKDLVTRINGSIEMNGVYFRYAENAPYILENFNLRIKAGEYVGIVGKTGCGKSTLVRLLLGFEKPEKGVVFYDGKDLERIDLKSLRRKIGSVIQDGKLFYGDIFQNISIASEKLTMDQAWEAAEMAGIADDIRAMPMGMYTIISEGQGGISGGQRQRILIARAIASKPRVLIFDEATSALDNITQKQIAESLDNLKCTRIVIAHRLSTIKNCDRILVMDKGNIAEQGSYEKLMEKKGLFYELVQRQQL